MAPPVTSVAVTLAPVVGRPIAEDGIEVLFRSAQVAASAACADNRAVVAASAARERIRTLDFIEEPRVRDEGGNRAAASYPPFPPELKQGSLPSSALGQPDFPCKRAKHTEVPPLGE